MKKRQQTPKKNTAPLSAIKLRAVNGGGIGTSPKPHR